jgi:hypothetical protein
MSSRAKIRLLLLIALALHCASRPLPAQEEVSDIKPPFGLAWAEPAERLERLLKGAKATIVNRTMTEAGRERWDVTGLVQTGLKRTVFYFRRAELVEVELQYQRDDWDEPKYDDFMVQVRRRIEQRYGPGQQIIRRTGPEGPMTQTLVGYQWNRNNTAIDLIYYSLKDDGPNVFRTLSVHYKVF